MNKIYFLVSLSIMYVSLFLFGTELMGRSFPIEKIPPATNQTVHIDKIADVCIGDFPYTFRDSTFYSPGVYEVIYSVEDDTIVYSLTIHARDPYLFYDTVKIYKEDLPYLYRGVELLTEIGSHTIAFQTVYGCDSIYILELEANPILVSDEYSVCDNELPYFYAPGDTSLEDAGVYTFHFETDAGFDSIITFTFHVNPTYLFYDTLKIYREDFPYHYRGVEWLTEKGSYRIVLATDAGCDSVYMLELQAYPAYVIDDTLAVCDDELPYYFANGDSLLEEAGSYVFYYKTFDDFDSIRVLEFQLLPTYIIYDTVAVCRENLPHSYLGLDLMEAGNYDFPFLTNKGCDSIVKLRFDIYQQIKPIITGANDLCVSDTSILAVQEGEYADFLWTTGEILPSIVVRDSGTFIVYTVDHHGCSDTSASFTVVNDLPTQVIGTTQMCANDSTLITASGGAFYSWNTGATTPSITVKSEGTYFVTVSNNPHCKAVDSIVIQTYPIPALVISPTQNICLNTNTAGSYPTEATITIQDTLTNSTFRWSTDAITSSITVSPLERTTYKVTATNQYGCKVSAQTMVIAYPEITLTGNMEICRGEEAVIEAGGGSLYDWSGSGDFTFNKAIYSPQQSGNYAVLVTTANGCFDSKSFQIVVNTLPNVNILGNNTFCRGDSTELTASGDYTYLWSTGETTPTIYVKTTNSYSVTATNSAQCTTVAYHQITTKVTPNPNISGPLVFCEGQSTTLVASGGNSYRWSTGSELQSITVETAGTYTVTVTNSEGCSATSFVNVTVNAAPSVTISGEQNLCQNKTTVLTATSGYTSYLWSGGYRSENLTINQGGTYTVTVTDQNGCTNSTSHVVNTLQAPDVTISGRLSICENETTMLTATAENVTYQWSTGATSFFINVNSMEQYSVTVTSNINNCTATKSAMVIVNPLPNVTISGNTTICRGESTMLTASGTNLDYSWTTNETTRFITVQPQNTTSYTVHATDVNGCNSSTNVTVTVNALPAASITGNSGICEGSENVLTANGGATYLWSTNDTTRSLTVNSAGEYMVTVYSAAGCASTATITTTVNPNPVPEITGRSTICEGESAELTASGGTSYQWSSGGNANMITPTEAGEYTVTVTNSYGCTATQTTMVIVNENPEISISGDTEICETETAYFTVTGNGALEYRWSTEEQSAMISTTIGGIYSVTATNSNQCTATESITLVVNPNPIPAITGAFSVCPGNSTTLTAAGGVSYRWSHNSATTTSITVSPTSTTSYFVTVTDIKGCSSSTFAQVTINPSQSASITGNTSFCAGSSTTLTAVGGNNVIWSNDLTSQNITVTEEGSYGVTITNSFGCTGSSSVDITILPLPLPEIIGNTDICQGDNTTLNANGGVSYLWSNGLTNSSIEVSPVTNSSYTVTVTNEHGCDASTSTAVSVRPVTPASIIGNNSICQGSSTTLTASPEGVAYAWSTGDETQEITVANPWSYMVTVYYANGCSSSALTEIIINQNPIPQISGNADFCREGTTTLTASGGVDYLWSDETEGNIIVIDDEGVYTVTVTNSFGCSASTSVTTSFLELPVATISGSESICKGESTTLSVPTTFSLYQWSTGDNGNSVNVSPESTTTYTLTLTNFNGCSDLFSKTVVVNPVYNIDYEDNVCEGLVYNKYGFNLPVQDEAGTFVHKKELTTVHGCDSIINLTLTVNPKPVITEEIVGQSFIAVEGNYLYTINNTMYATGYQWTITNPSWVITQDNTKTISLHVPTKGSGTLAVLAANSCGVSSPATLEITSNASIEEQDLSAHYELFPNPVTSAITIRNTNNYTAFEVVIFDLNGRLLHTAQSTESNLIINMENYAAGYYIVRIKEDNQWVGSAKIVKQK